MNFIPVATLTDETFLITPRYVGQVVRVGVTEYVAEADEVPMRVYGSGEVSLGEGWWDRMLVVAGDYQGDYFDGSYPDTELERHEWAGTPDASASTRETREILTPAGAVWVPDPGREFDFGLRSRQIDHVAKIVHLDLATDEALLIDYASLAVTNAARAHEASLRAVCNYVLSKIGAALAPGGNDANVTAYWQATNLITNPDLDSNITGWLTGSSATTIAYNSGAGVGGGAGFLRATQTGTTGAVYIHPLATGSPVTPGTSYAAKVSTRAAVAGAQVAIVLRWIGQNDSVIKDVSGSYATLAANVWTEVGVIGSAPPGAEKLVVFARVQASASGRTWDLDRAILIEGNEHVPFFDGNTPADSGYTYTWEGTANDSPSTRTPLVERLPELFVWNPGVTAWDFLQPLITSTGLRLFCDEHRVWRLIDPATYGLSGLISVSGANATVGTDTISRSDAEVFAVGVVVKYTWRDKYGIERVAHDTAGDPHKVILIEYDRPWPGVGAASAILKRRNGTGRTQEVSGLADWRTTPAMEASITLPHAPEQRGRISDVTFRLGDDGLMDLGTRGLIDIPPGSIDALDGTIDGLVGTIDSLNPA